MTGTWGFIIKVFPSLYVCLKCSVVKRKRVKKAFFAERQWLETPSPLIQSFSRCLFVPHTVRGDGKTVCGQDGVPGPGELTLSPKFKYSSSVNFWLGFLQGTLWGWVFVGGWGGGVEIILDFAGDWGRGWPLGNLSSLLFLGIWAQDGGTGALGGPRNVRWDLFINVIH